MEKTFSDFVQLDEGVNDPGIFKAVFLAGGPGSGKSFIVGQTALTSYGLKVVNSDDAFERMLHNAGMEATPSNIYSPKGQSIRDRAKLLTKNRQTGYVNGRLGLVVDGTGKDFNKIQKQVIALRNLGYDCAMVFVNTDLETAQNRNAARTRTLPANVVDSMWNDVQKNIGKFQNLFGREMFIVDNSDGANWQGATLSVYRRVGQWVNQPISNHKARKWIADQKKARNIKEGKNHTWKSEGHYTKDGKEWTGPQHAHDGQVMTGEKHTDDSENLYHFKELPEPIQKNILKKLGIKEEDIGRTRLTLKNRLGKSSMQKKLEKKKRKTFKSIQTDAYMSEAPRYMMPALANTLYRTQYKTALKLLSPIIDRKKKEGGGKLKHPVEYYALDIARQISDKVDARTLANMYRMATEQADTAEYDVDTHQWGKPEGTDYYKRLTPGQEPEPKKATLKEEEPAGAETKAKYREDNEKNAIDLPDDYEFSEVEIKQMEDEIDNMSFEDMTALGVFEPEEVADMEVGEDIDLELDDDEDYEDDDLSEALTVQGRMKRRFAARRNRQKLKVARMRASRRAADPARLKKRASRGARNMIKQRFARGRDISSMPPQEKARIEAMAKRFSPLVQRLAVRMLPQVRKNELARIKSGSSMKSQKAKKFKITKGGNANKYKAKKYKIKKAGK